MWTSAQVLLAKTVLYVKMFPAVIDAVVNQDLQAETVKKVCGLERLSDQLNHTPLIDILLTPLYLILSQIRKQINDYIVEDHIGRGTFYFMQEMLYLFALAYLDIDECAGYLCKNGASCQNIPGSYLCWCKVGFTGRNCDTGQLARSLYFQYLTAIYLPILES